VTATISSATNIIPPGTSPGIARDGELLFAVGYTLANSNAWPNWSTDSEFRAARDRSSAERSSAAGGTGRLSSGNGSAGRQWRARLSETLEPALPDDLDERAERLMHALCDRGWMVSTAESCTGGMLAALMTDIEGASHGFDRGFVTYTKQAKADLLGVDPGLLEQNEAVSEPVARAMAVGAIDRSSADVALAVTGFAGPPGDGCEEGLVHLAIATRDGPTRHRVEHFGSAGRGPVRILALNAMLGMLEEAIQG
jgi:nicotinamide-nucleotide amidase